MSTKIVFSRGRFREVNENEVATDVAYGARDAAANHKAQGYMSKMTNGVGRKGVEHTDVKPFNIDDSDDEIIIEEPEQPPSPSARLRSSRRPPVSPETASSSAASPLSPLPSAGRAPFARLGSKPVEDAPPPEVDDEANAAWTAEVKELFVNCHVREGLQVPGPEGGLARCVIKCDKPLLSKVSGGGGVSYDLFTDDGMFLMGARKRVKTHACTYLLSTSEETIKRGDGATFATVSAAFAGNQYSLLARTHDGDANDGFGLEEAALSFDNVPAGSGVRMLHAAVPLPGAAADVAQRDAGHLQGLIARAMAKELRAKDHAGVALVRSVKPRWNGKAGEYGLFFVGRKCHGESTKNVQMAAWNYRDGKLGDSLLFQMVKLGSGRYALDFGYPFTAQTAFAMAVAIMDKGTGVPVNGFKMKEQPVAALARGGSE